MNEELEKIIRYLEDKCKEIEKDFEVQKDGEYHFGKNQKVIGYNLALSDVLSIIKSYKVKEEI